MAAAPTTATATTPKARPWQILEGETSSKKLYWQHFRDEVNSAHPSCSSAANASPMDTEEQDQTIRVVSYVGERRAREEREGGRNRRETRRDRERRRGMAGEEGRRDRNRRDQERAREDERRQRDRGDRANRERREPKN